MRDVSHTDGRTKEVWVDADVLLRLLTGDPPALARKSLALVRRAEEGELRLRLSPLVVGELMETLISFYGYGRERAAEAVLPLVTAKGVRAEEERIVVAALRHVAREEVDFADAYLAEEARAHQQAVASFDEGFGRLEVERVSPG
jgi:predicted nucleic acid-binding protein